MKNYFRISWFLLLFFLANVLFAQTVETIDFKNGSFSEALATSKSNGKLIFIDCYTSWCAPCKKMEKTVFVNDTVYKYYNNHFVNFKIDMEKGEGIDLRKKYEVKSFPTYLFVNSTGDIVHRTTSLMPASDFLKEAQMAMSSSDSYSLLKEKYNAGDRSNILLLKYAKALRKINRDESQKVEKELVAKISDEELNSEFGWNVIVQIGMAENDRFGTYLLSHKTYFEQIAGKEAVQTVLNRIKMADMYKLIREKNSDVFFVKLDAMRKDPNPLTQRNVAMLEMEYYLEVNNADSFIISADKAMAGVLENNDADLSFVARRALYKSNGNEKIEREALLLARKAVVLNPEEYSNQGTLGTICLQLKLKEEGLRAARKARLLADESTSKIQKLAQELVDKLDVL